MLPLPSMGSIPEAFREGDDPGRDALCNKVDSILSALAADTKALGVLGDPGAAPAAGLEAMGGMFEAGIGPSDSESVRRRKIAGAVEGHKKRYTWASVKAKIDAVTGLNASIVNETALSWPVRIGDGSNFAEYGLAWSSRGGAAPGDGTIRMLSGEETIIPGVVNIDVGSGALTPDQVAQIAYDITLDGVPAYFKIKLGYMSGGLFVTYPGGVIG